MSRWLQSFEVPSMSSDRTYVVSLDRNGQWGCSCPQWTYRKATVCKHIRQVQARAAAVPVDTPHTIPQCRVANVPEVQLDEPGTIMVPLLPLNDRHFLATVIVDLLMYGVPFEELRRRYHLRPSERREDFIHHIIQEGRRVYDPAYRGTDRKPCLITRDWNLPEPVTAGETPMAYHRRTGCPLDLTQLAFDAMLTRTIRTRLSAQAAIEPLSADTPGKRRLLRSS